MASDLVMRLLGMNAAAALAILAVLALRKPVRAAAGARTAYALWLIVPTVSLACLLPPRTVFVTAPRPLTAEPVIAIAPVAPAAGQDTPAGLASSAAAPLKVAISHLTLANTLVGVWLCGIAEDMPGARVVLGILPYFAFSVLYDPEAGVLGFKAR